jgi:hypothetical protein
MLRRYILLTFFTSFFLLANAQETNPRMVFQIGTFVEQGNDPTMLFRFWVVGGQYDASLSSEEFGRVEYGNIEVFAPDGTSLYKSYLDDSDVRVMHTYLTGSGAKPGVYTAYLSFTHQGELQQFKESVEVNLEEALATPLIQIAGISTKSFRVDWEQVPGAQLYEVELVDPSTGRYGDTLLMRRVQENSFEFNNDNFSWIAFQVNKPYQIIVTALSRPDDDEISGQLNSSERVVNFKLSVD